MLLRKLRVFLRGRPRVARLLARSTLASGDGAAVPCRAKSARAVARAAKKAASIALKDRDRRLKASATDFPSPKRGTKRKYSGGRDQAQANEVAETAKKMRVARVTLSRVIAQQREYEQAVDKLAMEPVEEDDYSELMDVCDDCDAAATQYDDGHHCDQWDEAESVWDQCFE